MNKASSIVMNNYDLRYNIISYFNMFRCEQCKTKYGNFIKTKKFCICKKCFLENWKEYYCIPLPGKFII